jgi:hypothetical protein
LGIERSPTSATNDPALLLAATAGPVGAADAIQHDSLT